MSYVYFLVKTPFGITNRDFLHVKKFKRDFPERGMWALHYKSVEHPLCPEKPRVIRAYSKICGYIFEEMVDANGNVGTRLSIVS